MRALKFILVVLALLLGVLFVYDGLGFEYRIFNHVIINAYGVPIGIAMVVLAVLMARYWNVASDIN